MTQDEIIRMAREAGLAEVVYGEENGYTTLETKFNPKKIADFAALVAAHEKKFWMEQIEVECNEAVLAEREACAKVCEENGKEPDDHKTYEGYDEGYQDGSNNCAEAIRARSKLRGEENV